MCQIHRRKSIICQQVKKTSWYFSFQKYFQHQSSFGEKMKFATNGPLYRSQAQWLTNNQQQKKNFKKNHFNHLARFWRYWRHVWRENGESAITFEQLTNI
jgi:hypothetical protein